ncbi:MAG: LysR family transcriptional regulator [Pseudomonadota bacterium]|nr:LysR family transcriptional regulator [Pseudomonadota bacterium]
MQTNDANWFMRARLKTRQLLLLVALDDERNIHRAADRLHTTQPAASKQLKDLEDVLGVSLFERHPRGMTPTSYGEAMIRHSRMALTSLSLAHEDIIALKAGLSGQVDVGVILAPAIALLPRAIARVKQHAPMLRIGVELEGSNVLLDKLQQGVLDFMVARILEQEHRADLQFEELADEPVVAVARNGHPLHDRDNLTLEDIHQEGWILSPRGAILRHRFEMMFRRAGLQPPTNVVDTTGALLINSLLQQTDFLHVMPLEIAEYYQRFGMLKILAVPMPCRMDSFGIITRTGQLHSPGALILLQAIRDIAREIYPRPIGAV